VVPGGVVPGESVVSDEDDEDEGVRVCGWNFASVIAALRFLAAASKQVQPSSGFFRKGFFRVSARCFHQFGFLDAANQDAFWG
jgi:hypothetical protein